MTQGRRVATYVSAAHSMLGLALLLAGARVGESLGWWTFDRLGAIAAHFHLAAFGFAGLTAVGVGGRMLPMFLVSGAGPDWPMQVIGPAAGAGLIVLAGGLLAGFAPAVWLGALLGTGAAVLFMASVAGYFRRRLIPVLEPAFGHVLAGFASLALALTAGIVQLATPGVWLRGWIVYAELTVLGWLVVFITGIWYRLFAFLIWLHFYRGSGVAPVRTAAELVHRGTAWAALGLLVAGVMVLVSGSALASVAAVRAGAGGVLGGSLLIAAQYARIYSRRAAAARPAGRSWSTPER